MAEQIDAKDQTISKAQAEKAGVRTTSDDIALSDDNLVVSGDPAPASAQPESGEWFTSDRALHLTADGKVVEEDDEKGVKTLVGAGGRIPMEEAKKYGLSKKDSKKAAKDEAKGEQKKGKLPEDFPHLAQLEAAGITTYAKARALKGDYSSIEGIGEARGKEIDAELE